MNLARLIKDGFKKNYAVFAVWEGNAVTLHEKIFIIAKSECG